jgi:hypothetical protein
MSITRRCQYLRLYPYILMKLSLSLAGVVSVCKGSYDEQGCRKHE